MKFHPAAQIMTWCLLVAAIQSLASGILLGVAGFILLTAMVFSGHGFTRLLRRTRWIMLSLLLIYAYSTPGQPLLDSLGMFSPSREGLTDGMLQLVRLLAALAGLAILLDRLNRQQLIAGLYTLSAPLQWLGLSRERLAVRLALTLHYAEAAMMQTRTWNDAMNSLSAPQSVTEDSKLELPLSRFSAADALLLGGATAMLWMALR